MPETTPTPLRLTVRDIFDLYWVVTRRVSNESAPKITSIVAELPGGIAALHCGLGSYPRVHLTTSQGAAVEIDTAGHEVEVRSDGDGWTYYSAKIDRLPICWLTRQGTGPTIVGGGK